MRIDVYLEDVLEEYSTNDALYAIEDYLSKLWADEKVWFVERIVRDLMEENYDEYLKMMENIKELEDDYLRAK